MRPRDYDIDAIHRAAQTIAQGRQGLLLRLLEHSYFLDKRDVAGASEALSHAALIYNESALNVPAEWLTVFVFGTAYIWHDPAPTRAWWAHVEAKKPILNSDYWLAHSALRWVEGDLKQADESLERATRLAEQLPKAGAYEFERYRCSLLRHALDEVPVAASE